MKKTLLLFVTVLFVILATSCASAEKSEKMARDIEGYKLPVLPTDSTSVVYVVRQQKKGLSPANIVPFWISVDDAFVGLGNGAVAVYVLKPGEHTLFANSWPKGEDANTIPFKTEIGQLYFYQVDPKGGWPLPRVEAKSIDKIAGTYSVKHLYSVSTPVFDLSEDDIQFAGQSGDKAEKQVAGTGNTELEHLTIHWNINTRPQGADCYWRIKSSTPDVKNQNEKYLAPSPYESTETYDIKGLSRENAGDVQVEIRCTKTGHLDQKKVFNMLSVIDEKEISIMMTLVKDE